MYELIGCGHREDVVKHEGPDEPGHDRRALALEGGLQGQGRLVLEKFREEPGAGAVGGCLLGAEEDSHQTFHRSRGNHLKIVLSEMYDNLQMDILYTYYILAMYRTKCKYRHKERQPKIIDYCCTCCMVCVHT